jgi:hypothetical protein
VAVVGHEVLAEARLLLPHLEVHGAEVVVVFLVLEELDVEA